MEEGKISFTFASIIAAITGMGKFVLLQINSDHGFWVVLVQAAATAFVCALSGAIAKFIWDLALKPFFQKLAKRVFKIQNNKPSI